jgi:hypothetical protein
VFPTSWAVREKVASALGYALSAVFVALGLVAANAGFTHRAVLDLGVALTAMSCALAPQPLFQRVGVRPPRAAMVCSTLGAVCLVIAAILWFAGSGT